MYTPSPIMAREVDQYTNYIGYPPERNEGIEGIERNERNPHFFGIQKKIPVKIILSDDMEVTSMENSSETTDEMSNYHGQGRDFLTF